MNALKSRIVKATSVALVLALTTVCVNAALVRATPGRVAAGVGPQSAAQGRLVTRGNNAVSVNGASAHSGETIFSGQTIQTPAGVGATVNLPGIGRVDIAPNSNATLSFEQGKLTVTLASGCAILTANRGTAGTMEAGGSSQQTDGMNGGTIDACAPTTAGGAPVVGQGAAAAAGAGAGSGTAAATTAAATSGGLFGLGTPGTIGFIGSAALITTTAIVAPCRRGANPSPGVPRGRNDECRN
jgi:hypothetical protein